MALENYANLGDNWAAPKQSYMPRMPNNYYTGVNGNLPNTMDLASDGYQNSGIPNVGGLSYGQKMGGTPASASGGGLFSSLSQWGKDSGFLGSTKDGIKTDGWGGAALGAAGSIFNAYMGMKQYGLAKEQFKFNKDMTTRNFNAQANQTNMAILDRDKARQASGQASNNSAYLVGKMG